MVSFSLYYFISLKATGADPEFLDRGFVHFADFISLLDWLPSSNLIMHTQTYFLNLMMAEYVLRAERKDNSDGKTMF